MDSIMGIYGALISRSTPLGCDIHGGDVSLEMEGPFTVELFTEGKKILRRKVIADQKKP